MYKPPKFTPEMTRRFTEEYIVMTMGTSLQELQEAAELGVPQSAEVLLSVQNLAEEHVQFYHPERNPNNVRSQ